MTDSTSSTRQTVGQRNAPADATLQRANETFARRYPGEVGARQPVHTVYGGAQLFRPDTAGRLGTIALRALEEYAPDADMLGSALGIGDHPALDTIHARVREKLEREAVEDFRIDFEDGYGNRPDAEEDGHAESAAREVARGLEAGTLPPFIGIRIKPFTEELHARSIRTLDIFLSALLEAAGGRLPENFFVTLPKVTVPEQVAALADLFDQLETSSGLAAGTLK
ncbi:MAG: phosphoenolpyruvate kinase, partial [Gemmatimonadota bacterium]|nr:phosphoenolpyruvate kinase [Gemmatimonadota bacterium]